MVPGCSTAPPPPQHLYVWLVSEKAHERQRAVNSCMSLLKFLSNNLYLDVSARALAPRLCVPAKPAPPRARRVQGPWAPATHPGWIPECPAGARESPSFLGGSRLGVRLKDSAVRLAAL